MILALGLPDVLVNGSLRTLEKPVVTHQGEVFIPNDLAKDDWWDVLPKAPKEIHRFSTVIIDAGHGGKDPGALGKGIQEKEVVLDIAKKVESILTRYGINVIMTRSTDEFISLKGRTQVANKNGADFFVSIHANASKSRRASGFEIYTLSEAVDDDARAVASAENKVFKVNGEEPEFLKNADPTLWDLIHTEHRTESIEMAETILGEMKSDLKSRNRGHKTARFYVLRGVETPSVLVEVGFVTHPKEAKLLNTQYYRQQLAHSIAQGVLSYKRQFEETNGFTD